MRPATVNSRGVGGSFGLVSFANLANDTYIGFTIAGVAGEALAFGDVVYLKPADLRWWKAKGDLSTTMSVDPMIAVSVAAAGGDALTLLEWGYIRHDAWALTAKGDPVYVSSAWAGLVTDIAPNTAGHQVQILGKITNVDNIIKFAPSRLLLEVGTGLTVPLSGTIASSATPYPSSNGLVGGTTVEVMDITALAVAAELQNPVATPSNGQRLMWRITTNDGSAKAITYGTIYLDRTSLPLPATTVLNETLILNFIYDTSKGKFEFVGYL